jgi:hypothetical protein
LSKYLEWVIPEKIHTSSMEEIGSYKPSYPLQMSFSNVSHLPLPPDSRNFLLGGRVDLFWNNPIFW